MATLPLNEWLNAIFDLLFFVASMLYLYASIHHPQKMDMNLYQFGGLMGILLLIRRLAQMCEKYVEMAHREKSKTHVE